MTNRVEQRFNRAAPEKQAGEPVARVASRSFQNNRKVCRFPVVNALALAAVLVTAACEGRVDVRGNKPDPDILAELESNQASRAEVEQLLGTPSTTAMFTNETWLYISKTTNTFAFFDPEIVEQTVVVIQFSDADQIASVDRLGVEDGRIVQLNENRTPTLGNEFSAIEQLLNNIGRFNKD